MIKTAKEIVNEQMIKELNITSQQLRVVINDLEDQKDSRLEQVINNLKQEEENLDSLIMNMEDDN